MPVSASSHDLVSLLVLAVVQGITEFLPVSSDGHLVLTQALLGFDGPALSTDVALHLGTLVAVLVVFRGALLSVVRQALGGDWREVGLLFLGSIPAAVVGLGMRHLIERLFESAQAAAWGLLVTAGFLVAGELARRRLLARAATAPGRRVGWGDALWIGSMQALAILPGVSRSGTTIATALVRGIEPTEAARFSFLLSIPAVGGALLLETPGLVRAGVEANLVVAVLLTFAVGVIALRVLLAFLGRGAFVWCAGYCVLAGSLALVLLR